MVKSNSRRYLLDTHFLLWWLKNDKKLKPEIETTLADKKNLIYTSVISAWEISIKLRNNPEFKLKTSIKRAFRVSSFEMLDVSMEHVLELHKLPLIHKDSFDRMLIAQALAEKCVLITADEKIKKYRVKTIS